MLYMSADTQCGRHLARHPRLVYTGNRPSLLSIRSTNRHRLTDLTLCYEIIAMEQSRAAIKASTIDRPDLLRQRRQFQVKEGRAARHPFCGVFYPWQQLQEFCW